MSPDELIAYFGSVSATARALGVKDPSVSEWKASGIVPDLRQYQAEIATQGILKADTPALRQPPAPPRNAEEDPLAKEAAEILLRNGATMVYRP